MPFISAENVDDNVLSSNINPDDGLDLCSEDLDMISDIGSISSQSSIDASTDSTQNSDEYSQELIKKLDNANNGDTILIEPGTYKVHGINITKNISLQGNGDPRDVIIDGEGLSTIFFIQNKDISVAFNNLTLINGKTDYYGGGICIETGNVYVDNCIFINNSALEGYNGGAISNYGNNEDKCYLFVNNSLFIGNHADSDGGAVTTCFASSDIYNSMFINNSAHRDGGAICLDIYGYANVQDCIFMYNHADEWAGAYYSWAGNSSIDRCVFINNTADKNGGAFVVSGSLNLTNSIIVNNTANKTAGSFYIQQPMFEAKTVMQVKNNIITNNSSPLGREIFVRWKSTNLLFSDFNGNDWGNEDPTDSSVVDPNNVSKRIKPTTTAKDLGLFNLLDFSLLDTYSDVLEDYYGSDYKDHFERFSADLNDSGLESDNKTDSDSPNEKISGSQNDSNSRNPSVNQSNESEFNSLNNESDTVFSGEKSDIYNSAYVNDNSYNKRMVELFDDNPTSQKSFDIKYILALAVVLILCLFLALRKRDRSS